MTINVYTPGSQVRVTVTFRDEADALTDPTLVTGEYRNPAGTIVGATVVNESTGVYHFDVEVDASGTWYYRFEGTGAVRAAAEAGFIVAPSRFP